MRILIVDDSAVHLQKLSATLERLGHEVVGRARSGAEGVRLFEDTRPELVFVDIVMPEMDGLSALRLIRSIDSSARVIVLSSAGGVGGQVEKALQLGAVAVLAKPATLEDLNAALAKASGS